MPTYELELTYQEFRSSKKSIAHTVIDKYIIYERIGQGAFGSVYRGMNDQTKKQIAVKVLDLVSIEEDEKNARVREIRRRLARTESEMMMLCDSPHVMKCYDVYENKDLKIMMIEYCNGGTLSDMLTEKGRIPEKQSIDIIKQIIFGIAEMHKHNIIHRDLKSQNIMFHNGVLKIVDLGFSKTLSGSSADSVAYGTTLGTIITMAPQVMRKQKYGLKADIWSIGIILYEIIYGKLPYQAMRAPDMYEQIIKKDIFPNGGKIGGFKPSQKVLNFMKRILAINQDQRLNWKEFIDQEILNEEDEELPENFRVSRNMRQIKQQKLNFVQDRTDDAIEEAKFIEQKTMKKNVGVKWNDKKDFKKNDLQKASEEDQKIVKWVEENHLQCKKTEFILKHIILPIQQKKMINFDKRLNNEWMYLLIARCFFNMSYIYDQISKNKEQVVISLRERVNPLYQVITKKFSQYCEILRKIENGIGEIVKDRFSSIFNSSEREKKDRFLVGVELVDYSKEEQIQYTIEKYTKSILKENKLDDIITKYIVNYGKINFITLENLQNKTLSEKIKEIITC